MHDGGDGGADEEENSFSDGRYHQRHQGEAASRCYGFLCFVITLYNIRGCGICSWPADLSAAITPSANRNSYRVAKGAYRQRRILLGNYDWLETRQ